MTQDINEQTQEAKALTLQEPQNLEKPRQDTEFAHEAAKLLVQIIEKNNWSKKLGGQSAHIMYEGWQTAGKYYGYAVKTYDAEYVELGGTWGFKAKATVVNEHTGIEVGSAEAYCMSDENNWRNKPKFQLASMAQTRAGSKALRQNLGFVVALAGYNPTPAEEMTEPVKPLAVQPEQPKPSVKGITPVQKDTILKLLERKGKSPEDLQYVLETAFQGKKLGELSQLNAENMITKLISLPDPEVEVIDNDQVESGIEQMKKERK